ncbi:hypothetical protein AVEN_230471-1 [Araneus ventricosus]|uniref:Uncharacterized protein n=1 Tax=Araneus ventricosus TaxID=182803 RepID=A0A4Y2IZ26_ARAVE|nr:hypothetical protein AVEN_230471-1 [Araneus ventricosus]
MPEDTSSQTSLGFPLIQPVRTLSTFHGEAGENPTAWLKEYERIAKFNRWDDTMCLANAYFFVNGIARTWYENNEEELNFKSSSRSPLVPRTSSSNKLNKNSRAEPRKPKRVRSPTFKVF